MKPRFKTTSHRNNVHFSTPSVAHGLFAPKLATFSLTRIPHPISIDCSLATRHRPLLPCMLPSSSMIRIFSTESKQNSTKLPHLRRPYLSWFSGPCSWEEGYLQGHLRTPLSKRLFTVTIFDRSIPLSVKKSWRHACDGYYFVFLAPCTLHQALSASNQLVRCNVQNVTYERQTDNDASL
jgi:hypothetical protein